MPSPPIAAPSSFIIDVSNRDSVLLQEHSHETALLLTPLFFHLAFCFRGKVWLYFPHIL
jgi:hypothetical protein